MHWQFKLIIEKKTLINENVLWKYLSLSKYHQFRLHLEQIIFNENRYSPSIMTWILFLCQWKTNVLTWNNFHWIHVLLFFPSNQDTWLGAQLLVIGYRPMCAVWDWDKWTWYKLFTQYSQQMFMSTWIPK